MLWRIAVSLWLVLGEWGSHAAAQPPDADSLGQHWLKTLSVPEADIPMVVLQHISDIRTRSLEANLEARALALRMMDEAPNEVQPNFHLLALCLEIQTQRYINKDSLKQGLVHFITENTLAEKFHLAAEASFRLSAFSEQLMDYASSAYFALKGRDLMLRDDNPSEPRLYAATTRLASISFNTAQFRDCVTYALEAIANEDKTAPIADLRNTLGLGYRGLGLWDSAMYWFKEALALAEQANSKPTIGMVEGNMAQVYFARGQLNEAYPLLESDVQKSLSANDIPAAMNSLQFIARIQALQGKSAESLVSLHTCLANLPLIPNMRYRQNIMEAAALVYYRAGKYDSARYATALQIAYRDSMQARISSNRMGAIAVQLNYENSLQELQKISLEKQLAIQRRNLLVIIIILVGMTAWLVTNRQRLALKHRQQLLLQQKQAAEQQAEAAGTQLMLMNQNLVAKSAMVEALQQELASSQLTGDTRKQLESLRQSVILTEDDWLHYRELFEKVHPGFVQRMRQSAPDISQAEMRLAVLTRLQFDNKQMAGILGISADSVTKTRRRLKARLQLPEEKSLSEHILEV